MKLTSNLWRLSSLAAFAVSFSSWASAQIVSDDFESYADGSTIPNQTFNPDFEEDGETPHPKAYLKNLITAATGVGLDASQGASIDTQTVEGNYRVAWNEGVAGSFYQFKASFQMTINHLVPEANNHTVASVGFSNKPEWWNGSNITVNLVRRNSGLNFALSGIGKDTTEQEPWQVVGWEPHTKLGLPAELPAEGETATSDWFTMVLTLHDTGNEDAGRTLWNVIAEILDETGAVVLSHTVNDRLFTEVNNVPQNGENDLFSPGDPLYPVVVVPWVDPDGGTGPISGNGYQTLVGGGLSALVFDNLQAGGASEDSEDPDGDGFSNALELANGSDPFDAASDPASLFSIGFTADEGYVDSTITIVDSGGTPEDPSDDFPQASADGLGTQQAWLGQNIIVQDTAGTGQACAETGYLRATWGNGVMGGTGGVAQTDEVIAVGDSFQMEVLHSFTLDAAGPNAPLGIFGYLPERTGNDAPAEGFSVKYSAFNQSVNGGGVKFIVDKNQEGAEENASALIIPGHELGLDPADVLGNGADFESDPVRITYTILAENGDDLGWDGNFTVQEFSIENLATGMTYDYDLETSPVSFAWTGGGFALPNTDAFLTMQLGRTNASNHTTECVDAVTVKRAIEPDVVVDPPSGGLAITDSGFVDENTFFIEFSPGGLGYKVTTAAGLDFVNSASEVTTSLEPTAEGENRFEFAVSGPTGFFRVEEE
ncbi:thrombospondin type 3 repeat-containing protein [Roseibacillus ishigakijimensis]|uniref:Uncharacterized protein n=1 Tax=Roseibacillus ishigakijimensis TaxID=454146 RepID=A0A934RKQ3_9BACT|nr:thrombospondin type 3 repeat-containing protein [Roseibacillus ishigakijimensis]MBK1832628.1 hypothetical protein [Roseibacillus ishigakijimensis]